MPALVGAAAGGALTAWAAGGAPPLVPGLAFASAWPTGSVTDGDTDTFGASAGFAGFATSTFFAGEAGGDGGAAGLIAAGGRTGARGGLTVPEVTFRTGGGAGLPEVTGGVGGVVAELR